MTRRYRKRRMASNRVGRQAGGKQRRATGRVVADAVPGTADRQEASKSGGTQIVERDEALAGRITVALPVRVAEVIEGVGEEIEELARAAGLSIMQKVMEREVAHLAGPKGRHDDTRQHARWGRQRGYVVLHGAKLTLDHPRVRHRDGREVRLKSYARFQSPSRRQQSLLPRLIHGISTRKYDQTVKAFTEGYGLSKSALSRDLVRATGTGLKELCERRMDALGRLAVLMIDGKEIAGEQVIVALGVDAAGKKHVLGLMQGSTENSTVVQHLLDDLVDRGLDTTQPMLLVLDGSKALRKAVNNTFGDRCAVQRCQIHKRRNVKDHLPPAFQGRADQRIRTAYAMRDYEQARAQLLKTVAWLDGINPSAAASLREGLEETLTLHRLRVPEGLRRSLKSTNLIESALSVAAQVTRRVKRWRAGDMRLRWSATGLREAEKNFRRVRGYRAMPRLLAALDRQAVTESSRAA